jgi:fermentation-respiration switch protein FrsA (DUF1100 family)
MNILANPLPPTEFTHPQFVPWAIAGMEGLLLGAVLWWWSGRWLPSVLVGFAINSMTLALFWLALRRDSVFWEYDFSTIAIGELVVVVLEAGATTWFLSKRLKRDPTQVWWRAVGVSLVLNAFSFVAGALVTSSPIPDYPKEASLLTPSPPRVQFAIPATA